MSNFQKPKFQGQNSPPPLVAGLDQEKWWRVPASQYQMSAILDENIGVQRYKYTWLDETFQSFIEHNNMCTKVCLLKNSSKFAYLHVSRCQTIICACSYITVDFFVKFSSLPEIGLDWIMDFSKIRKLITSAKGERGDYPPPEDP